MRLEALVPAFVAALCQELRLLSRSKPGLFLRTVFFGGGTPSLLKASQLAEILGVIRQEFVLDDEAEITLEANPNDIDEGYACALFELGINRISLGMQSSQEHELRLFARRHGNEHLLRAIAALRVAGLDNYNLDLIFGIPQQRTDSWEDTLQQALRLRPKHLSLYALGLEKGTPLYDWVARGILPRPDDDRVAEMYEFATDYLAKAGYPQYEISNWCLRGHECRHNLIYWRNEAYLACGPGAYGYAAGFRYRTIRSPQRYIAALQEAIPGPFPFTPALAHKEKVDAADELTDTLMMGLRLTEEGVDLSRFREPYALRRIEKMESAIARFREQGFLEMVGPSLRLTRAGRFVSNAILSELCA